MNPWRKFWPPTGPISPAQKPPAAGTAPRSSATTPASWSGTPNSRCPRPLHVKSNAAVGLLVREQRPEVLVGGGGVADVELDGLADGDLLADRDRAGLAVGADHVADEEVAAAELRSVLVDDDAEVQALLEQRALLVGRARGELAESLERGPPGELADEVALRLGHDVRVADRPAALRDDRVDARRPRARRPTAPRSTDRVVDHEPVAAGTRGRPTPCRR